MQHRRFGLLIVALFLPALLAAANPASAADGEWRHYGSDAGGQRFSALKQLTPENVAGLERAWVYRTQKGGPAIPGLQVTPLMVGDALYVCTPYNVVISLDAESGEERWRFVPPNENPKPRSCRGVAYYEVPVATEAGAEAGAVSEGACAARIITATGDAKLFAIDAQTGKPCEDFGAGGAVDLTAGMGEVRAGYYYVTSAPTIVRGKVVLGGWVSDNQYVGEPSGVIRAFDAVSGAFAWAWDMDRPGEHGEPGPGESYSRGTANSWAPMSADEALGLVYLPTGNATPDYWGGHRSAGSEKYSTSVVALDAETGAPRWVFQTLHHDVWDYDVGSQPTLVDLEIDGEIVPALVQPTKHGEIFLLDRRDGRPLAAVEEKPVPQGPAKGDWLSPTQPFSTGMPALDDWTLAESDMWGLTPIDQLWCRIKFRQARYEGPLTPPGTRPTITFPGYMGGMEWGGVSLDPNRKLMVVNWSRVGNYTRLIPRAEADAMGVKAAAEHISGVGEPVAMEGTPFATATSAFLSPLRIPCNAPPYGMLTAIDLNSREIVWSRPLGTGRDTGPFGVPSLLPLPIGVPNVGGSVITSSGLVFIAATMERALRAVDLNTGKTLWKTRLPVPGNATPMTYISPKSGRQFVIVAAGGHGAMGGKLGDHIIAYSLPRQ